MFEALKGLIVLVAGFGLFALMHHDVQAIAERLVRYSHLNPARRYPQIFIQAASHMDDSRLRFLAVFAFIYASGRLVEAYGLWRMRTWAEWLAIFSGSIYVPIEIYRLFRRATFLGAVVLLINTFIVVYLVYIRLSPRVENPEARA
jgi:uncharacterized membrane protein (DUF2068 family)